MEAYLSTLDPGGKGSEILRAAATEVKDMDGDEVANLEAVQGVAVNLILGVSCLRLTDEHSC